MSATSALGGAMNALADKGLMSNLVPVVGRRLQLDGTDVDSFDPNSIETIIIWAVLLVLHILVMAAFCCCERPMADPQRAMEVNMKSAPATSRSSARDSARDYDDEDDAPPPQQSARPSTRSAAQSDRSYGIDDNFDDLGTDLTSDRSYRL